MSMVILEIGGINPIQGECGVAGHTGQILCESFSQDAELEIDSTNNMRRTIHVPKINNLSVDRKMDKASGPLLKRMLTGKVDTSPWYIHCLRALGDDSNQQAEYMTITLTEPILTKHEINVNDGDTTERFEINCATVFYTYSAFDEKQGPLGSIAFGYNTIAGTVI